MKLPHVTSHLFAFLACTTFFSSLAQAFTSYPNDFVDPNYMLSKKYPANTGGAQFAILKWADFLAAQGPWTVIDKPVVPPSGDLHDYMSWSPYSWPNCSELGNTTELPLPQVWSDCPYYLRDGLFNPDVRMINNTGHFNAMADTPSTKSQPLSNHGSYYYSQLASHQLIANDIEGARETIKTYFHTIYMSQITATGEQPLEARRTRPYHYRAYNLIAMMTNARIGDYLGLDYWNWTGYEGTGIKEALDYAMTFPPGKENADELYQPMAGVAAKYGDPDGKYAKFLANVDTRYPAAPYFLWCQPFSESGLLSARPGWSPKWSSGTIKLVVRSATIVLPAILAVVGLTIQ
ncbi:hypothetical protein ID866_2429 [Astraeus odoratus]|nr:hypothetical protein ID866_2429 [Astraeus odoratus]